MASEPGLDRHTWETEWQALEPLLEEAPLEAVTEMLHLVERALAERGIDVTDEVAFEGVDPEIAAEVIEARRVVELVDGDEPIDVGDVGSVIEGLRAVYAWLVGERTAP